MEPGLADRRRRRAARAGEGASDPVRGVAGGPSSRPGRLPPDRRRGQSPRRARSPGTRTADRASSRVHRSPRRCPGRHRRARCRRPAVLSRGAGPDDPRGDGAVTAGRRIERRRDPRDGRGRRHRPARAAPRCRSAHRRDRPAATRSSAGRHPRSRRPRPRPRSILHRADGQRRRSRSTTTVPRVVRPSEVTAAG